MRPLSGAPPERSHKALTWPCPWTSLLSCPCLVSHRTRRGPRAGLSPGLASLGPSTGQGPRKHLMSEHRRLVRGQRRPARASSATGGEKPGVRVSRPAPVPPLGDGPRAQPGFGEVSGSWRGDGSAPVAVLGVRAPRAWNRHGRGRAAWPSLAAAPGAASRLDGRSRRWT